ncbi:MAG: ABC transporter permease [bacterium]
MVFLTELWENLRIALGALRANKLRSILTTLGIIIGITTVIAVHSIISGLNESFYNTISRLGSDTLYIQKFKWFSSREEWLEAIKRKDITIKEAQAVKKYTTLARAVSPEVGTRRTVKYGSESLTGVRVAGTTAEYRITSNALPEYGRFLSEVDVEHNRLVCVIGYEVAEKLFKNVNPLGRRIKIGSYPFRVIGILEKQGRFLGFNMDSIVIIPIGVFQKLYGSRRWLTIVVKVIDPELMDEAKDELIGIMRRVRKVPPGKENDFAINQQDAFTNMYKRLTSALYAVAFAVGSIALLVGGIGIMNIMLVSVHERTREIGLRKAIGAKRRDILWQFLIESIALTAVGGVIGIILAFAIAKLIAASTFLVASISPWSALIGVTFIGLVGIFFGIYPASKAARLDPIEALRYE